MVSANEVSVDCRSRVEVCKPCRDERHWSAGVGRVRTRSARSRSKSSIVEGSGGTDNGDVKGWLRVKTKRD